MHKDTLKSVIIYHFTHPWSWQPTTHRHGNREEKILDADASFFPFTMFKVPYYYHPHLSLLSTVIGLLRFYPVLFFSISLSLPPPPFLHIFYVQPPVRIHTQTDAGMQCCNTKYAQADTICSEKHIQSERKDGVWLVGFLQTPANGTQRSPSGHPPLWLELLMKLKPFQQGACIHTNTLPDIRVQTIGWGW